MKECYHFFSFCFLWRNSKSRKHRETLQKVDARAGSFTEGGSFIQWPELGHLQKVGHLYDGQSWVIYRRWVPFLCAIFRSFAWCPWIALSPTSGLCLMRFSRKVIFLMSSAPPLARVFKVLFSIPLSLSSHFTLH
jgi:hypothetical protein